MNDAPKEILSVIALVRDLMFVSKIRATASTVGVEVKTLRDPAQLQSQDAKRLMVDLNLPGAIDAAIAWKLRTGGVVIAFVAHTEAELISRANAAGFEKVLTRGQFTAMLADLIAAD